MSVKGVEIAIGQIWRTRSGRSVTVVGFRKGMTFRWQLDSGQRVNNQGHCSNIFGYDLVQLVGGTVGQSEVKEGQMWQHHSGQGHPVKVIKTGCEKGVLVERRDGERSYIKSDKMHVHYSLCEDKPRKAPSILLYGPQGSGKTTHAKKIAQMYGLGQVFELDNWDTPPAPFQEEDVLYISNTAAKVPGLRTVLIAEALAHVLEHAKPATPTDSKPANPKDVIGVRKVGLSCVPAGVLFEISLAMMEGAAKYGRHNHRGAGVRASVYYDAAMGHLADWWEGEDIDAESNLSHVTKALGSLTILRDAMLQGMLTDNRPPRSKVFKRDFNQKAGEIIDRHADKNPHHWTINDPKADQ